MKKLIVTLLAGLMVLGLVACGGPSVAGTYTHELTAEDLAGATSHNGFLSALSATQKNTLVLNEDNTYSYTKTVTAPEKDGQDLGLNLTFEFTGTYTAEENVVTLEVPTDCKFEEAWGALADAGMFLNSAGSASNGDKVQCKEGETHDPLDMFLTPYYLDSTNHDSSVVVTINTEDGSFTYNEVASSDDE